ncbi:MAG: hypothetical protein ABIU29_01000 [Chthoniobacterales bacterium]
MKRQLVSLLALMSGFVLMQPTAARLLRTGPSPLENWNPLVALTIGSSVEYERAGGQAQLEFPFFVEYNFTPALKATIEPSVVRLGLEKGNGPDVTGLGDLETALDYEFLPERRYQPALIAEAIVRWPSATNSDLGEPGRDYAIGLIASKDLVFVDLDLRLLYTFLADRKRQNNFEISLAGQWHLNYLVDLEAEIAHSFGGGGTSSETLLPSSGGAIDLTGANLTEGTVGLAWHVSKRLKLEHGAIFASDGSWRAVLAWEFSFGGD